MATAEPPLPEPLAALYGRLEERRHELFYEAKRRGQWAQSEPGTRARLRALDSALRTVAEGRGVEELQRRLKLADAGWVQAQLRQDGADWSGREVQDYLGETGQILSALNEILRGGRGLQEA